MFFSLVLFGLLTLILGLGYISFTGSDSRDNVCFFDSGFRVKVCFLGSRLRAKRVSFTGSVLSSRVGFFHQLWFQGQDGFLWLAPFPTMTVEIS